MVRIAGYRLFKNQALPNSAGALHSKRTSAVAAAAAATAVVVVSCGAAAVAGEVKNEECDDDEPYDLIIKKIAEAVHIFLPFLFFRFPVSEFCNSNIII